MSQEDARRGSPCTSRSEMCEHAVDLIGSAQD